MRFIILFSLLVSQLVFAQEQTTETEITVTITNVPGDEGQVIVALHDTNSFMKTEAIETMTSEIKNGKATVTFTGVPPGEYGIISFHDKNENKQIDMEPNGMPKEAYGVSNNPMSFGPPQWNEAKFTVAKEPLDLEIRY
jgi:uncharacterized protein (DUF2141 family)